MEANDSSNAPAAAKRSSVVKVLHWGDSPPSVVSLVGPLKHRGDLVSAFRALTLGNNVVLMPPMFGPADSGFITGDTKKNVEELQFRMIDMCDIVYVVSPKGYMDAPMREAVAYAESLGRVVKYLNS